MASAVPLVKSASNFPSGFAALTGNPPYPWQQKLFDLLAQGKIPPDINLPTGSGKTSIMPIWLLALAHQAQRPENITLPRRLVWVVNRRVVVDQASDEARQIRERRKIAENKTMSTSITPKSSWARKTRTSMRPRLLQSRKYRDSIQKRSPDTASMSNLERILGTDETSPWPPFLNALRGVQAFQALQMISLVWRICQIPSLNLPTQNLFLFQPCIIFALNSVFPVGAIECPRN